jgi:hypothetical protein
LDRKFVASLILPLSPIKSPSALLLLAQVNVRSSRTADRKHTQANTQNQEQTVN